MAALSLAFLGCAEMPGLSQAAPASPNNALVEKLKSSAAYLELPGGYGSGTAFCISADGYYVTCAHVVSGLKIGENVSLVMNPGATREKAVKAVVTRSDPDHDIAILKAPAGAAAYVPLPLAPANELKETDKVMAAGFPYGRELAGGAAAPDITITTGSVTSIRRENQIPSLLQMDADLNPGNSGGPVVDTGGRVVGVASAKLMGTRLNFAVSVNWVSAALTTPGIVMEPLPQMAAERAAQPLAVPFHLDYIRPPTQPPQMKASFEINGGSSVPAQVFSKGGGAFEIRGTPVASPAALSASVLRVEFSSAVGNLRVAQRGRVPDSTVKVGNVTAPLSSFAYFYPAKETALRNDGTEIKGAISGLEQLKTVEGNSMPSPSGYEIIVVRPEGVTQATVTCKLEVVSGSFIRTQTIPLNIARKPLLDSSMGSPAVPAFNYAEGAQPSFTGDTLDVELGGAADAFAWGGGGRYMVARLPQISRLVIIDCLDGKTVGTIPLKNAAAPFTAGGFDLLVADDTSISRWALKDLSPQPGTIKFPGGKISALAMGSSWTRQVGVLSHFLGDENQPRLELRDVRDGRVLAIEPDFGGNLTNVKSLIAADQERLLSVRGSSYLLRNGSLQAQTETMDWPDAGGAWSMSLSGGLTMIGMRGTLNYGPGNSSLLLPTSVPSLVTYLIPPDSNRVNLSSINGSEIPPPELTMVDLTRHEILIPHAVVLDEANSTEGLKRLSDRNELLNGYPERIRMTPQLGLLATVSWNSTVLRLRKYNLWEALKAVGARYLYVTGVAPDVVAAGVPFECALMPRASAGTVKTELQSGPPGMTVDAAGNLHWPAPVAGLGGPVVIRFFTDDGSESVWSHEIWAR